jgi:serine/threonine protein kinase
MAPELLANDICGKEADIWAFGCILYEMHFKKSPFSDANEGMIWKKILTEAFKVEDMENSKVKSIFI